MTTLLENPMPVIFFGVIAEAVLAIILVSNRQGVLVWAMLGVLVLVSAGVALNLWVVTDAEKVEATLDGAADALEANDWPRLQQYISEGAVRTRNRAFSALSAMKFTSAKISSLKIEINRLTSPPTADTHFIGAARFEAVNPERPPYVYRSYTAEFHVELQQEDDRWLVTDKVEYHELR